MATTKKGNKKEEEKQPKKILLALQPDLEEAMGYIIWKDNANSQTEWLNDAVRFYVSDWEKRNGKIPKR